MAKEVNTRPDNQEPARGPVDKAMEVLEALVQPGGPHRLGEIARRAGLNKPTVHRHLRAMSEHGFAEPSDGGSYRAGPRLLGLAAAALSDDGVPDLIRPALHDLRQRTGHLAFYAVRHAGDAVYLEQSEPAREYRMSKRPGSRTPLHSCGVGLAMLSALSPQESTALLQASHLEARTPRTLTDPSELQAALEEARLDGYAVEDECEELDIRSVAACVLDADDRMLGAIGIAGPTFILDHNNVRAFGPMVRAAARTMSAGLGGRTPSLRTVSITRRGDGA